MLSGVLHSDRAVEMNIAIMRAFIVLRQFALQYKELAQQIIEIKRSVGNHNEQLNQIYEAIENLLDTKVEKQEWKDRERIGFMK